jgi:fibronectin type 3 domain-containing protein
MRKTPHLRPAQRAFSIFAFAALSLLSGCGKLRNLYAQKEPEKPHSVTISWKPSVSRVAGYNVYRATPPNRPVKLTPQIVSGTQYIDKAVDVGRTYTYSVTSVDFKGAESAPSGIFTVTIPTTAAPPAKQ